VLLIPKQGEYLTPEILNAAKAKIERFKQKNLGRKPVNEVWPQSKETEKVTIVAMHLIYINAFAVSGW